MVMDTFYVLKDILHSLDRVVRYIHLNSVHRSLHEVHHAFSSLYWHHIVEEYVDPVLLDLLALLSGWIRIVRYKRYITETIYSLQYSCSDKAEQKVQCSVYIVQCINKKENE